jgi:hypothetical protein
VVTNLKALGVVLCIAWVVFYLADLVLTRLGLVDKSLFKLRRNAWLFATAAGFLSPSFWIYAAVLILLLLRIAKRDPNPAALYLLMLHVIPPLQFQIPTIGIGSLIELSQYRLLSLFLLFPLCVRYYSLLKSKPLPRSLFWADAFVIVYLCWQLLLTMPYWSATGSLRAAVANVIDYAVPFYVFSRVAMHREKLFDTLLWGAIGLALISPMAAFESLRNWLLYVEIGRVWGDSQNAFYLMRDGVLRAEVSTGHALAMGYMLAVAFGVGLYLRDKALDGPSQNRIKFPVLIPMIFWLGLIAAYSKGPWLVGALVLFIYLTFSKAGLLGFGRATGALTVIAVALLLAPMRDSIIDKLPFIGTAGEESVTYRSRLAEISWDLMWQTPLTGNVFVLQQMEELRTGEGIIDLLNVYLSIGMFYGVTGLLIFLVPFAIGLWRLYSLNRELVKKDIDCGRLAAVLLAALLGTMLMMGMGSFGTGLERYAYVLVAMGCGIGQLNATVTSPLTSRMSQLRVA